MTQQKLYLIVTVKTTNSDNVIIYNSIVWQLNIAHLP